MLSSAYFVLLLNFRTALCQTSLGSKTVSGGNGLILVAESPVNAPISPLNVAASTNTFNVQTYTLRIDNLVQNEYVINLAEIEAFSGSTKLTPIFTEIVPAHVPPVGACFDGVYDNYCHSAGDGSVYLIATYSVLMDSVVVTNRQDCCQERIVGARMSIKNDVTGATLHSSTFQTQSALDQFSIYMGTPSAIGKFFVQIQG
jgi:hypothetical protein